MPVDLAEECALVAVLLALLEEKEKKERGEQPGDATFTTRSLAIEVGISPATMKRYREEMEKAGVFDVRRLPSSRKDPVYEIRLTPPGAGVATDLRKARAVLLGPTR